jgi:hypothetical protein
VLPDGRRKIAARFNTPSRFLVKKRIWSAPLIHINIAARRFHSIPPHAQLSSALEVDMKMSGAIKAAACAAMVFAPGLASASDEAAIASCAKSFIAEQFPDRVTSIRVEQPVRLHSPLLLRYETNVKLVATGKTSGRVIATATCNKKDGVVTVLPIQLTAAVD